MTARGFFTVLAMTVTAAAAYFALMPTHVEVPNSVLPDAFLDVIEVGIGGPLDISFDPASSTTRFDCGPIVSPTETRLSDSNVLSDAVGHAERIERRVKAECDQTHDRRWQLVVVALIAAGTLLGFALVSRRRPAPSSPPAPAAPPPGSSSTPTVRSAPGPSGPPLGPPLWNAPPTSPPTSVPLAAQPESEGSASALTPRRRKQIVGTAVAGVAGLAVLGGVFGLDRGAAQVSFSGFAQSTEDPVLIAARQCTTDAFESIDASYEQTRTSSAADLDGSNINLDGDASWQDYSDALRGLDLGECAAEFRTTVVELANAWGAFGDDWLESTKGLSFESLSDDELLRHSTRINAAMQLLQDLAADLDLDVREVTYTFGG